ncbi:MAG: hypothetical protein ACRD1T_06305, partial [Acidimicrobiia bacterium]
GAVIQLISYPRPDEAMKLYYGGGPSFRFARSKDESVRRAFPPDSIVSFQNQDVRSWAVGLAGILGVEWFMNPRLSLLAEYGATLEYSSSSREARASNTISPVRFEFEDKVRLLSISSNGVRFGLSAYF